MAGVLGNPIGTMGQDLGNNIDLNTIVKSGLYSTLSSQNQPDGYEEWYGLLSVSKFRTGEVIQTWTPNGTSSNGLFERKKNYNSNAWSNWQRIDNFGYNSLAELAGGVAGTLGTASVKRDNIDSTIETGIYGHGSALFDGGNFGVLLVFRNITQKYVAQIDICSERNISYRFGFEYEGQIAWGGWRTHS